ncbi:MAG TPA: biliverdin-producing heme oxygenase [Flavisolibacter sp.]|nr:biliverdin-producing heme oxygenase [Flavisolibacter sp.]
MPLTFPGVLLTDKLKQETQAAHEKAEQLLGPHLSAIRDKHEYASLLKMLYGFYHPLEQLIGEFVTPAILEDIHSRRNAALILLDLDAMKIPREPLPLCGDLPVVDSVPAALGALYVLEGSTLGGRMISKMLQKKESLSVVETELNFFSGYKEDTGPKWTLFKTVINQWDHEAAAIVMAANASFESLSDWISQTMEHGSKA